MIKKEDGDDISETAYVVRRKTGEYMREDGEICLLLANAQQFVYKEDAERCCQPSDRVFEVKLNKEIRKPLWIARLGTNYIVGKIENDCIRLTSNKYQCYVFNQNFINTNWFLSVPIVWEEYQVQPDQVRINV